MAVFEMLPKVVCTEELFRVVAFSELMYRCEMLEALVPIRLREIRKFFTTVPTAVVGCPRT